MTDQSSQGSVIDSASFGVADLANSVTSALGPSGTAGALAQPVVGVLRNVWEGYFGAPVPPGTTNWNAYTHQQLYDMLWDNADVHDVASVATEWGQHSAELGSQAGALHDQRNALRASWSGAAADPAVERLGALGDRTQDIGTRADTVAKATQQAGDALAAARNTMPPPAGDPLTQVIGGALAGAGLGAAIGGAIGGGLTGGFGTAPGAMMGAAMGAVAGGAASLFLGGAMAAEQKAEAVHVMQRYESSLRDSHDTIAPTPAGATDVTRFGAADLVAGPSGFAGGGLDGALTTSPSDAFGGAGFGGGVGGGLGGGAGGVPWGKLVGAGVPGLAPGAGASLGPGGASGADVGALLGRAADLEGSALSAEELAAARSSDGGFWPGMGAGRRGRDDQPHRNRLPTREHRLFEVDERASKPVIGE